MNSIKSIMRNVRHVALLIFFAVTFLSTTLSAEEDHTQLPFKQGVNLTNWFELWSPGVGNFKYYDKTDLVNLKSLGVDVIRLPVHFENLSNGAPDYKVNELTWQYLDKVVDWCEELHIYLVIDNHSFNTGTYPQAKQLDAHLQKVWPQIAERYKNRSQYILYEILNEPNQITATSWNKVQENAIAAIRKYDTKHTIVVGGVDWNDVEALKTVKIYNDNNLIYTFHFYLPFTFTHQGASWAGKEEQALSAIPFPYEKNRMPPLPKELKGTWMETGLDSSYKDEGTEAYLRKEISIASSFSKKHNVPVWCGEMGAYNLTSLPEDRVRWYKTVGGLLHEYKIPFTVWGYGGGFGLFKKDSHEIYPYDLDTDILSALSFTIPNGAGTSVPQDLLTIKTPFIIFDDLAAKEVSLSAEETSNNKKATLLSCTDTPAEGMYCICWGNRNKYDALSFTFLNEQDFSSLVEKGGAISFNIRSTNVGQTFDVRFVDDEQGEMKPWRMSYSVNKKDFVADGTWHTIVIPFSVMKETGAWLSKDGSWHNAENKFSWQHIKTLQFVAESNRIIGDIYIDNIQLITDNHTQN